MYVSTMYRQKVIKKNSIKQKAKCVFNFDDGKKFHCIQTIFRNAKHLKTFKTQILNVRVHFENMPVVWKQCRSGQIYKKKVNCKYIKCK